MKDEIIGDVRTQSVKEIWNGIKLERVRALNRQRRRMELKPCTVCNWGNLKQDKSIKIRGQEQKVLTNVAMDMHKEQLKRIEA